MLYNWPNLACCKYAICSYQLEVGFWLVCFLKVAEVWRTESSLLSVLWCCLILRLFLWVDILRWQRLGRELHNKAGE